MNYFMPTRLYVGEGSVSAHATEIAALGNSCLIVCDKVAASASGALADIQAALEGTSVSYVIWDGVTENPPVASCIEAGEVATSAQARFVLGVGGGSALDAAKAISVFAANPGLSEEAFYQKAWEADPLPIVLVGTTSGTGSEVTKVSVLTDKDAHKHSIHDDRLFATISLGDARYTRTCPLNVSLSCGVDILAHATESYFSKKADEISRAFAVRAIGMAAEPLLLASMEAELTEEHYDKLYEASILAGLAINTTGTCFPHNVGYYLTENFGVPHGFASAIFLPDMLELCNESDLAYASTFYREIGFSEEAFVRLVDGCIPELDVAMSKKEVAAALPRWENNGSVMNTRADVSCETIRKILRNLF